MKQFLLSALPFVLAGLAVCVICAKTGGKREKPLKKSVEDRLAAGMLVGLCIGVALDGVQIWGNQMIGLTLGPLWGMAIASLGEEKRADRGQGAPCSRKEAKEETTWSTKKKSH